MATSFTIAARNNGFTKADAWAATLASVAAYREAMAEFSVAYADHNEQDYDQFVAAVRSGRLEAREGL